MAVEGGVVSYLELAEQPAGPDAVELVRAGRAQDLAQLVAAGGVRRASLRDAFLVAAAEGQLGCVDLFVAMGVPMPPEALRHLADDRNWAMIAQLHDKGVYDAPTVHAAFFDARDELAEFGTAEERAGLETSPLARLVAIRNPNAAPDVLWAAHATTIPTAAALR